MKKNEIRRKMKMLRDGMIAEENLRLSLKIAESLFMMPEYKESKNILIYVSFGSEVNTAPIIADALNRGMRVGVPRIDMVTEGIKGEKGDKVTGKPEKVMNFYEIRSCNELIPGFYGIPEPDETHTTPFEPEEALVIVPGLVFDKKLFRIGYGGGFYDRYLSENEDKKYIKCGIGFDFQLTEEIEETYETDVPLDIVISDERSFRKILIEQKRKM